MDILTDYRQLQSTNNIKKSHLHLSEVQSVFFYLIIHEQDKNLLQGEMII